MLRQYESLPSREEWEREGEPGNGAFTLIFVMHFQDLGITTEFFIYQCSTQPWIRYSILAIIYGCFGFLQVCSLYFAFQTRKVKVKGLNDAKYIAVIVYITTIVLAATLITSFALSSYINIFASVYSIGIWVTATVILGVMFIPKV